MPIERKATGKIIVNRVLLMAGRLETNYATTTIKQIDIYCNSRSQKATQWTCFTIILVTYSSVLYSYRPLIYIAHSTPFGPVTSRFLFTLLLLVLTST